MKIVLDASALIYWTLDPIKLTVAAASAIEELVMPALKQAPFILIHPLLP